MFKKSLTFTGITLLFIIIIFLMIGLFVFDQKKEQTEKKEAVREPVKSQEVKIIALKEEIPAPIKVIKKKRKKEKKKTAEPKKTDVAPRKVSEKALKKEEFEPEKLNKPEKVNTGKSLFPAIFSLNRQSIEAGKVLIDNKLSVPIVQASYDRIGFGRYLKRMHEMGGKLFVGDALRGEILAKVLIFYNGKGEYSFQGLESENMEGTLDSMALFRPREISGEELIREVLLYSGSRFKGDLRCVILLPIEKEAAILGSLKEYLNIGEFDISAFDLVWGHYFDSGNEFGLKLESGQIFRTGEIINLDMTLVM